jgi:hypothetical protein
MRFLIEWEKMNLVRLARVPVEGPGYIYMKQFTLVGSWPIQYTVRGRLFRALLSRACR